MNRSFNILLSLILMANMANGQVYSDKVVGKRNASLIDSLKKAEYPYHLPIWGKKVAALGYKLPYSAGIGVNYLWQKSDLVIDNLSVGFNGGKMFPLDEVVRFNHANSEASVVNVRPDLWIFPFLNVYGIIATSKPSTAVGFGVWVPDSSNNWKEVFSYNTKANFNAHSLGFGFTPTIGVGGGWLALDMNFTWTDVEGLEKPAFTYVIGPRLGKTFNFKKKDQNFAFWVGGFRVKFSSDTKGSIALNEIVDGNGNVSARIDEGQLKVEETQQQVDEWWANLSDVQQNNPVNKAKYETANRALGAAANILTAAEGALSTAANSTIQYSLDKRVKDKWNFIVGGQYQLNMHWMVRAEFGFLGSRQQVLTGLQYRFGL